MSYKSAIKNWEGLAKRDALWSILTDNKKKGGKWDTAQFFASGEKEVNELLALLKKQGIDFPQQGKALDFGCGAGRLSQALAGHYQQVVGVDASPTMIKMAEEANEKPHLRFVLNQSDDLSQFEEGTYAFVLSLIVLQHIPYPQSLQFMAEFTRLLQPGGLAVFQVPTRDLRRLSLLQKLRSWLKLRERLALLGIGKGFHMHMYPVAEEEIVEAVHRQGAEVIKSFYTNHTDPDFNGELRIFERAEAASGYLSQLFVVKKRG